MKWGWLIFSVLAVVAVALLAGCSPDNLTAETDSCMNCHSGDTTTGNAVLAAQAQYENSGHFNGPRTLSPYSDNTGHTYVFHGSNSMYTNGSNCSKCHTHQGFVDFVAAGMPASWNQGYGAASPPGCFTCHKPHVSGDFSMRKESSETLADGASVFDYGKGNLCVTCHKALTAPSGFLTSDPINWRSSSGAHHGPQADFIMGTGHWAYGANSYQTAAANSHVSDVRQPDACVSCHMYQPTSRLGGTLELGGHGMYLTGDVHGSNVDIVQTCKTCHTSGAPWPSSNPKFTDSGHLAPYDWDGKNGVQDKLLEIKGLRDTLIAYLGNGAANFGGAGKGPIVGELDPLTDATSGEWNQDWQFNPVQTSLSLVISESFWNFKLFIEDHSGGIHNPTFAAQILYDAIDNLNDNAGTSLTLGTRP